MPSGPIQLGPSNGLLCQMTLRMLKLHSKCNEFNLPQYDKEFYGGIYIYIYTHIRFSYKDIALKPVI